MKSPVLPYEEAVSDFKALTGNPDSPFFGMGRRQFVESAGRLTGVPTQLDDGSWGVVNPYNSLAGNWLDRAMHTVGRGIDDLVGTDFAQDPNATFSDRVRPFQLGLIPGLVSNLFEKEGEQSVRTGLGESLRYLSKGFGASDATQEAMYHMGMELPGQILGIGMLGAGPVGAAAGLLSLYADAFNDTLDSGRSLGEARGAGAISAVISGSLPILGKAFQTGGAAMARSANTKWLNKQVAEIAKRDPKVAEQLVERARMMKGAKVMKKGKLVPAQGPQLGKKRLLAPFDESFQGGIFGPSLMAREGGLFLWGGVGDIMEAGLANSQISVKDLLTSQEYLVPMLTGNLGFVAGDVAFRGVKTGVQHAQLAQTAKKKHEVAQVAKALGLTPEEAMKLPIPSDLLPTAGFQTRLTDDGQGRRLFFEGKEIGILESDETGAVRFGKLDLDKLKMEAGTHRITEGEAIMLGLKSAYGDGPIRIEQAELNALEGKIPGIKENLKESGFIQAADGMYLPDTQKTYKVDAARRFEEASPFVVDKNTFVDRFAAAPVFGDTDPNMNRWFALQIFNGLTKQGLSESAAMSKALRLVESTNYKTYGDLFHRDGITESDPQLIRNLETFDLHAEFQPKEWSAPMILFAHDSPAGVSYGMRAERDGNSIKTNYYRFTDGQLEMDNDISAYPAEIQAMANAAAANYHKWNTAEVVPGVTFGKNVPSEVRNAVRTMMAIFKLDDVEAHVFSEKDAQDVTQLMGGSLPFWFSSRTANGSVKYSAKDKRFSIFYKEDDFQVGGAEEHTWIHEVGHMVVRRIIESSPSADSRLRAAHAIAQADAYAGNTGKGLEHFSSILKMDRMIKAYNDTWNKVRTKIRKQHPQHYGYLTNFAEWQAENYSKLFTETNEFSESLMPYAKEFLTQMAELIKKTKGYKPTDPEFAAVMEKFRMGMWERIGQELRPGMLDGLQKTFQLSTLQMDVVGRRFHQTGWDPEFLALSAKRLANWESKGRTAQLETVMGNALRDYKKGIRVTPSEKGLGEGKPVVLDEVAMSAFDSMTMRAKDQSLKPEIREEAVSLLKHFSELSSEFNAIPEVSSLLVSVHYRWEQGLLQGQTKPRDGGTDRFRQTAYGALKRHKTIGAAPERRQMKDNGGFDDGKVLLFEDYGAAVQAAEAQERIIGNEGYAFRVIQNKDKTGFVVERVYDELIAKQKFNEEWGNPFEHDAESRSLSEHHTGQHLSEYGYGAETQSLGNHSAAGMLARLFPYMGQKVSFVRDPEGQTILQLGFGDSKRVIDAFAGSGTLSAMVRKLGFKGKVLENDNNARQIELKKFVKENPEEFVRQVNDLIEQSDDNWSIPQWKTFMTKIEKESLAGYWLAQAAQKRGKLTNKGIVPNKERIHGKFFRTRIQEALNYATTESDIRSGDGWALIRDAGEGDFVMADTPYVGRNYYDDGGKITTDARLLELNHVFEAAKRGAKILYFDGNDPQIRAALEENGFAVTEVRPNEIMATNFVKSMGDAEQVVPQAIGENVRVGIMERRLSPELNKLYDAAVKEIDQLGGQEVLDAMARDLGLESGGSLADFTERLIVESVGQNEKVRQILNFAPEQLKSFLRSTMEYGFDLATGLERAVAAANREHRDTNANPILGAREAAAKLAKLNDGDESLTLGGSIASRLMPGGVKEHARSGGMITGPFRFVNDAYYRTFGGAQHLGEADPRVRDASLALHKESGLQNRIFNKITDWFHAKDPMAGDLSTPKKRAYKTVVESKELSQAYDQLRLLEQTAEAGVGEMLQKGYKPALDILNALDDTGKAAVMELIQRGHWAQDALTEFRFQIGQDVITAATARFLVRESEGSLNAAEAVKIVEHIVDHQNRQDQADFIETQAGVDATVAERVLQLNEQLQGHELTNYDFMKKRPWYVTERRMGRFLVHYRRANATATSLRDFGNDVDAANQFIAEIKSGGGKIITGKVIDTKLRATMHGRQARDTGQILDNSIKKQKELVRAFLPHDEDLATSINELFDALQVDTATAREAMSPLAVLKGKRKFKEGREDLNMLEQQLEHSRRVAIALARKRTDSVFSLLKAEPELQTEEGTRLMNLMEQAKLNMRTPDTKTGIAWSKFNFGMFLGLNFSSMLIEATQFPVTVSPILRELGAGFVESITLPSQLVPKAIMSSFSPKRQKDLVGIGWENADHKWIIRRAEQENRLNIRRYVDIDDDIVINHQTARQVAAGEDLRGNLKTWNPFAMMYRLGARAYAPFNRANAEISLVSIFEVLKRQNPEWSRPKLYDEAVRLADIANGSAGRSGRPIGWMSGAEGLRTFGQASFGLMSYSNAVIANWMRWVKKSFDDGSLFSQGEIKASRKALAQAVGTTMMGMGVMGLPMVKALSSIFADLFGYDLEETVKDFLTTQEEDGTVNEFWADLATNGFLYAAGVPMDVQSRLAIGGIAGFNHYNGWSALNLLGPAGGYAKQTAVALGGLREGSQGLGRVAGSLLPMGLRRAFYMAFTDDMVVRDTRNNFVLDPTAGEQVSSLLGFTPLRARKAFEHGQELERALKHLKGQNRRSVRDAIQQMEGGNIDAARAVLMQHADETPGVSYASIYGSFEDAMMRERHGPRPPQGMAPGKISTQNPLPPVSMMQDLMERTQLKHQFGFPAVPSPKQVRTRMQADLMMDLNPFMSPGLAMSHSRSMAVTDPFRDPFAGLGNRLGQQQF